MENGCCGLGAWEDEVVIVVRNLEVEVRCGARGFVSSGGFQVFDDVVTGLLLRDAHGGGKFNGLGK